MNVWSQIVIFVQKWNCTLKIEIVVRNKKMVEIEIYVKNMKLKKIEI